MHTLCACAFSSSPVNGSSDGKACSGGSEDPGDSSQMEGAEEAGQVKVADGVVGTAQADSAGTVPGHGMRH